MLKTQKIFILTALSVVMQCANMIPRELPPVQDESWALTLNSIRNGRSYAVAGGSWNPKPGNDMLYVNVDVLNKSQAAADFDFAPCTLEAKDVKRTPFIVDMAKGINIMIDSKKSRLDAQEKVSRTLIINFPSNTRPESFQCPQGGNITIPAS
ncbi:MAG: hypothetical protein K8S54_04390 [Spirochaetia bacterium]|nr:hypothetical protein [Spirochaetia bacterium]